MSDLYIGETGCSPGYYSAGDTVPTLKHINKYIATKKFGSNFFLTQHFFLYFNIKMKQHISAIIEIL